MYASNTQTSFSVSNFSSAERNGNGRSGGDSRNGRGSNRSNIDRKQAEMMKHFMQAMNAFASGFSGTAHAGTGANGSKGSNAANGSSGHCGTAASQAGGKGSAHGQAGGTGSSNAHGKGDCHSQNNGGRDTSGKGDNHSQNNSGRGATGKDTCQSQNNGGNGTSGKDDCHSAARGTHGKDDNHCHNNNNGKDDSPCDWTTSEVTNNQTSVDLGDYKLDFNKGDSSMILTNKTTGDATQVWGDPHIDFHNAGASSKQNDATFKGPLTFQLPDDTKITLGTEAVANNPGVTVTNKVTITQGKNSIVVDNLNQYKGGALQVTKGRDGRALDAAAPDGYTLVQQKDGKGWVDGSTGRAPTQVDFDRLGV